VETVCNNGVPLVTNQLTNSIELSSWEAANCSAAYAFSDITWNPMVHYRDNKTLILSHMNQHYTTPSCSSKIYFNIIFPPTSRSSKWSLSFWISHQNRMCIPLLPHVCYIPVLSHPPWLDHSNYIWWRVQIMKFIIVQFSPAFYCFIPLWSEYSPQHLQSVFLPKCQRPSFAPIQNYMQNYSFEYYSFSFLASRWEDKRSQTEL
jgi:hypothetical protein